MRIYINKDILGVELGGAIKNVIAIASGICDGIGYGDNTKAALLTRGISEIGNLGSLMGAKPSTFQGLSAMRIIVTIGWAIYPLGYIFGYLTGGVDANALNVIYNLADFINKIAFGLVIWAAAMQNTRLASR